MDDKSLSNLANLGTSQSLTDTTVSVSSNSDLTYTVNSVYSIGTSITIFLILWSLFKVISDSFIENEKYKKTLEYIDDTLFGSTGLLPNIFIVWVVAFAVIYIIYGIQNLDSELTKAKSLSKNIFSLSNVIKSFLNFLK
jgi:hypothetical protein